MTSPQSIAAALNAAADLIELKGRWTQGADARGERGGAIAPASPRAVCWCARGALLRVTSGSPVYWAALLALRSYPSITAFNDAPGRTQQEVVAKLREAARTVIAALPPRSM